MPGKIYKPTTNGRRNMTGADFSQITESKPEKSLLRPLKKTGGRNSQGRMTSRHRGGGHKRRYRLIDWRRRDKDDVNAVVKSIQYDPNRSARIALIEYDDGEKRYILAPDGIKPGDNVMAGDKVDPETGNCMNMENIPLGMMIHCIELNKGKGGQIVRSAGSSAQLTARDGNYVQLLMPSGEVRRIHSKCRATIGRVSNIEHEMVKLGKAGRSRWKGRRPKVRGKAMNPVAHPLGGGEGRSNGGRHPVSPTGVPAKGGKTRKPKRYSNRLIVRGRKRK